MSESNMERGINKCIVAVKSSKFTTYNCHGPGCICFFVFYFIAFPVVCLCTSGLAYRFISLPCALYLP